MPLPLDLPPVSRGFALLTPAARELGRRAAVEASRALSTLCDCEGSITGHAVPSAPSGAVGVALLRLKLTALPACGWIEVDVPLCVALLDRLSGAAGDAGGAARPTPLQQAALELAALSCLDAVAAIPEVAERLVPRLVRQGAEPMAGLSIEMTIRLGGSTGRARLVLPHAAVRALGEGSPPSEATANALVELSLRSGAAPLCAEELDALDPGDVVLVDPFPAGRLAVVAPGGLRFQGTALDQTLHIEELRMPEASSDYPIALEVELARVPVTLGDLARLEPGAVMPLPIDRRGFVALKLGDRTFARGQLVEVEGSVGVRIDSIVGGTR